MRQLQTPKQIFPVGLLVEGRRCLVVGGGRTALHKAELLLASGADVTVVCPQAVPELMDLAVQGRIHWVEREFGDSDLDGIFLAFAATDDRSVNQHVAALGKQGGTLVCPVDRNWREGDFLTPASFRSAGLVVSVSTGGGSSRRSRMVKDTLARHIEMVERADLLVVGTSHQYLSVEAREPYHLSGDRLVETGSQLLHIWGIHEFMILNTCNRVEVLAAVSPEPTIMALVKTILNFDHLSDEGYYLKTGMEAFEHIALTSAGLLSQSPGENHIVSQIKDALSYGKEKGWAGPIMQDWIGSALHISKHIRQLFGTRLHGREIEELCVDYVKSECPDVHEATVLVLGTGVVGRGLVRQLRRTGASCCWCYHRTVPDVPSSWERNVTVCSLDEARLKVGAADVIVAAMGGSEHILSAADAAAFTRDKPVLVVDIALPRNIDPALEHLVPGLRCTDLDGLKQWHRQSSADLEALIAESKGIADEHAEFYEKVVRSFQGWRS